jgi:hypothetical protein
MTEPVPIPPELVSASSNERLNWNVDENCKQDEKSGAEPDRDDNGVSNGQGSASRAIERVGESVLAIDDA